MNYNFLELVRKTLFVYPNAVKKERSFTSLENVVNQLEAVEVLEELGE